MIVRFNLEGDGDAVADVDDAGIFFARADENFGRLGREGFQQRPSVFVGTMLAPHHGEDSQFGVARIASEDFFDLRKFLRA